MGEINDVLCNYFSIPDIFADFWNGTLFEGEQEIRSCNLYKHDKEYYKLSKQGNGKASSIRRDICMLYTQEGEGLDMCKAFEDAISEGRAEGAYIILSELVRDGLLKLEEAAKRLNMTEEAFQAKMQE